MKDIIITEDIDKSKRLDVHGEYTRIIKIIEELVAKTDKVVKCETCNGTGKIDYIVAIDNMVTVMAYTPISGQTLFENGKIPNCPDCGGSGCKWREAE